MRENEAARHRAARCSARCNEKKVDLVLLGHLEAVLHDHAPRLLSSSNQAPVL